MIFAAVGAQKIKMNGIIYCFYLLLNNFLQNEISEELISL